MIFRVPFGALLDGQWWVWVLRIDKIQLHPQLQSEPGILIGIVAVGNLQDGVVCIVRTDGFRRQDFWFQHWSLDSGVCSQKPIMAALAIGLE
jgi:hypothetical protein